MISNFEKEEAIKQIAKMLNGNNGSCSELTLARARVDFNYINNALELLKTYKQFNSSFTVFDDALLGVKYSNDISHLDMDIDKSMQSEAYALLHTGNLLDESR